MKSIMMDFIPLAFWIDGFHFVSRGLAARGPRTLTPCESWSSVYLSLPLVVRRRMSLVRHAPSMVAQRAIRKSQPTSSRQKDTMRVLQVVQFPHNLVSSSHYILPVVERSCNTIKSYYLVR